MGVFVGLRGGTGVGGMTVSLTTLPLRCIQEPLMVRDRDGKPPRGPPGMHLSECVAVMHCWEILLRISRSVERDFLSVLSI